MEAPVQFGCWKTWALGCVLLLACLATAVAAKGASLDESAAVAGTPADALTVQAALPPGAGRILSLAGQVSVLRHGELWALAAGETVQPGQEIISGSDGHAMLELDDGSRVEVFPNSRVVFRANRGNWRDLLDVILGKVKVEIQKFGGRPNFYRVHSPTALIAVRGTVFEVEVESSDSTVISVEEGVVGVTHRFLPGKEVLVKGGETLRVVASQPLVVTGPSKMQILGRMLDAAADRAIAVARGGGVGAPTGSTPLPGGGSTSPVPGTGTATGQAPPPGGRPGDIPDGDTGGGTGASPPPATGGSPKPAPQPPAPREPRSPRGKS